LLRNTDTRNYATENCVINAYKSPKALGLMEIGPREATQGELQGELHPGILKPKFI